MQVIFFFLLLIQVTAYSATTIESDELVVNFKENTAAFKGNVKVKGEEISFIADSIEVTLVDGDINKIQSIRANSGSEVINATLRGKNTTYKVIAKEIVLDKVKNVVTAKNATLTSDGSHITGEIITYNINSGKINVSGKDKVKILIDNEKGKKVK
jgi:lipopolysaccharide transport protein LptA